MFIERDIRTKLVLLNQYRHFLCLAKINWMNMLHPSDCPVGFRTLGGEFQSVWATRVERD